MRHVNVILPKDGYFWVGALTPTGLRAFKVTEALQCACGQASCSHIESVKSYLRLEGRAVPEESGPDLPVSCPICGEAVRAAADRWRCAASPGHYWQHRGEQSGVKAFLTQPHPAKQGAFYEQTIEEREAFLAQVSHREYSPYHPKGV